MQASSDEVRKDVKRMDEEYSALKDEIKELKKEKQEIEEELKREKGRFDSLLESRKYYEKKICDLEAKFKKKKKTLKDKVKEYSDELDANESELREKDYTIAYLSSKLEKIEGRYEKSQQRMSAFVKESSNRRAELRDKSSVLNVLQDSLLQGYYVNIDRQAEQRLKKDDLQQMEAKQISQDAYIAEIKVRTHVHVYIKNNQSIYSCIRYNTVYMVCADTIYYVTCSASSSWRRRQW